MIWRDGQFRWPFVIVSVYVALFVYLFDFTWRVVNMPFGCLAPIAAICFCAGIAALVWCFQRRGRVR